jgi:hypothetical protein
MNTAIPTAPEIRAQAWLNAPQPMSLAGLRGRVVALHVFQMLCPGCVSHGIPQALAIRRSFAERDVCVIGLHSVFEHHEVMTPAALSAFAHEYRLDFPIAIDLPATDGPIPLTMQAYGLRGTPSLVLIDRQGRIRLNHFGRIDDLQAGACIGQLIAEPLPDALTGMALTGTASSAGHCDENGCKSA